MSVEVTSSSVKQANISGGIKRTKIIATIDTSGQSYETIKKLICSGANGFRLNFGHGTQEEHAKYVTWIRQASSELGERVAIIQDLQGPKIRLGEFDGAIHVAQDQEVIFAYNADYATSGRVPLAFNLAKKVRRGERILVHDGRVKFTVKTISEGLIFARAENEGILLQRKGVNLPDTDLGGDSITAKDRRDLAFGSELDIDYVALSFVHTSADIRHLKRILHNLGSRAKVIAKIETESAVHDLENIIQDADAVMVARGDLASETSPESVPINQRRIVGLGQKYGRPTIVATQLLASMTEASQPTIAEVSDVATAVLLGADAVMLSDETAQGRYPVESVQAMQKIITYTERHAPLKPLFFDRPDNHKYSRQAAISNAIITLADGVRADAIVAETKSGATALEIAKRRPDHPIFAVTSDALVANQLAIVYGLRTYLRPDAKGAVVKLTDWLYKAHIFKKGTVLVTCSGQYPGVVGATDTIKVRIMG